MARSITAQAHPFRWLTGPGVLNSLTALLSAATSLFRRRRSEPPLPRMSEEWLRNLEHESGRRLDFRDSW